ncbi:MAG: hypothetical protein ACREDR_17990 [Blastocatellia bacterium]
MHDQLMNYLTPMLGQATASNLLKHYCARMKIAASEIQQSHLPDLASSMQPMLAVWLGSAGAARVSEEIAQLGRRAEAK